MLLRDSAVAKEVRTQLLNTFEHSTQKQRTEEIETEQALLLDIAKSYVSGNLENFAIANKKYIDYQNRYIKELKESNEKLDQTITESKPKVEFAEAMIGKVKSIISIGEMAKLLHKDENDSEINACYILPANQLHAGNAYISDYTADSVIDDSINISQKNR